MKYLVLICLLAILLSSCTKEENAIISSKPFGDLPEASSLDGLWILKANYPSQRTEGTIAFVIANKAYVGMGNGGTDFWEFDPVGNKWTQKSDLGSTIRNNRVSFSVNNKGYAGLGSAFGTETSDFYQYDPVANKWRNVAEFPGTLGSGPGIVKGFSIGNKGYVINGGASSGATEMYEYDPVSNCWTKKASLPIPSLEGSVAFSIGNKGYAGTGFAPVGDMSFELISQFWQYDPITDKWTRLADFAGGERWLAAGFSLGNKGYIGTGAAERGGSPGLDPQSDFWEYNPVTDTWTQRASLKGGKRVYAIGFSIGNKGYLGLGTVQGPNSPESKTDLWEFDPNN